MKFGRDIFEDVAMLAGAVGEGNPRASTLDGAKLGIFEDVAHTMAKYADPAVPDTVEEWLDGFDVFSIYFILPQIIELWNLNNKVTVEGKKKAEAQTGQ